MNFLVRSIKGFYMALGMFTGIPMPVNFWDEKLSSQMITSLPLVGAVIGTAWWAIALALTALNIPLMLKTAALTVTPFILTGFIHLDGYMDTSDALLSRRPLEERLRILKDPSVGAFAVIMLAILFLIQFAAVHVISENSKYLSLLISISILSRSCSSFSIYVMRHIPHSGYVAMLTDKKRSAPVTFILFSILSAGFLSFICAGISGLITTVAVIIGYGCTITVVYKSFKGVSGDLLGYSLVLSELCGLIVLALLQGENI